MKQSPILGLFSALALLALLGCGRESPPESTAATPPPERASRGVSLAIVAGSENKSLEPIVQEFARRNDLAITMTYRGSVEIGQELSKGPQCSFDAVWPAASLWIELFDAAKITRASESIMRTPVVFAVKKSVAQSLGWIGKEVRVMDLLEAAEARKLRFAMTSATQSNSGASAYLGFLTALAGDPEVLTSQHLQGNELRGLIKRFLGTVNRSAGSSGFLKDLMVERYDRLDAMVNYEAMMIEANQALAAQGREPLYAIYPADGLTIADSPLAFVNKGDATKEPAFKKLQRHLLSPDVQRQIQAQGRRTGVVGLGAETADPRVFNPDWGIDLNRVLTPVRMPGAPVIREALEHLLKMLRQYAELSRNGMFPTGATVAEAFRKAEEAFHSPLVFYSWDIITDALVTNGLVQKEAETYYVTDLSKLIALIDQKKKWADLGLPQFRSSVLIHTTDPARSNSGNTSGRPCSPAPTTMASSSPRTSACHDRDPTPQVSDRRREVRWSGEGRPELATSIGRNSGAAVRLHRVVRQWSPDPTHGREP